MEPSQPTPHWKIILAAILDFLTVFFVGGYIIAKLTGGTTTDGFQLNGLPALVLLAAIIAYFIIGKRMGGTLWKRLLGVSRN